MLIKDKADEWREVKSVHSGEGKVLAWRFFQEKVDAPMFLFETIHEPGAYTGYHRHEGNEEIYYIVSGKAEYIQDGEKVILGPGDATLVKSGGCHGIKNIGDGDLRILSFCAALKDGKLGSVDMPLPGSVAHWKKSQ